MSPRSSSLQAPSSLSKTLVVLLAATSALGPVAMQILLPALPTIRADFQVSSEVAQLTLSLSMFAIAAAALIYGPLSDKYGRKPILMVGLVITLIGSVICLLASDITVFIFGRIIQAFGGSVGLVVARAIISDVYPPQQAARVIATLVMVMVVLPMLSPSLGGELIVRFGLASLFIFVIAFTAIMFVLLSLLLPETLKQSVPFTGVVAMFGTFGLLLKSRQFSAYAFCVAFVSVVFFSFIAAVPEIMISVLERPANEYGYYFILLPLGFMTGNFIARRYGNRIGLNNLIRFGSKLSVAGIVVALVLQAIGLHHPLALFLPVAITILGNGITLPNAQAAALNVLPQFTGSASGLTGFLQMGLSALAAQLVSVIYNGTAYPLLLLMLAASALSLLSFRLAKRD